MFHLTGQQEEAFNKYVLTISWTGPRSGKVGGSKADFLDGIDFNTQLDTFAVIVTLRLLDPRLTGRFPNHGWCLVPIFQCNDDELITLQHGGTLQEEISGNFATNWTFNISQLTFYVFSTEN